MHRTDNGYGHVIRNTGRSRNQREVSSRQVSPQQGNEEAQAAYTQSVAVMSVPGSNDWTSVAHCYRHEDEDKEDYVRAGQKYIEVASMIDESGGRLKA